MKHSFNSLIRRIVQLSVWMGYNNQNEVVSLANYIEEDLIKTNRQRKIEAIANNKEYVELTAENHPMFNYFCALARKPFQNFK